MLTLIVKLTLFIVHFVSTDARHLVTDYYHSADKIICKKCFPGSYWIDDCKVSKNVTDSYYIKYDD